jgi:uncharacterized membrane protein YjdF
MLRATGAKQTYEARIIKQLSYQHSICAVHSDILFLIVAQTPRDKRVFMTSKQGYGFRLALLGIFLATWGWAAWKPLHPDDWLLENYLVFFWVPVLLTTARFFRLSDISYGLITLFMCLHVVGSHYTYAEVPFGEVLQDWVGAERNMYDRLVHFGFGLLLAYPIREVLVRIARLRGFWEHRVMSGMRKRIC